MWIQAGLASIVVAAKIYTVYIHVKAVWPGAGDIHPVALPSARLTRSILASLHFALPKAHHTTPSPITKQPSPSQNTPSTAQSPNKPNRRSTSTASPWLTCHPNLTRGPKHLVHSQREYLPSPTRDPIRTWKGSPQPRVPPRKKSKPDRRRKTQNCDRCDSAICKCRRGPGDQSWGSEEEGRGGGETCVGSLEWVGR